MEKQNKAFQAPFLHVEKEAVENDTLVLYVLTNYNKFPKEETLPTKHLIFVTFFDSRGNMKTQYYFKYSVEEARCGGELLLRVPLLQASSIDEDVTVKLKLDSIDRESPFYNIIHRGKEDMPKPFFKILSSERSPHLGMAAVRVSTNFWKQGIELGTVGWFKVSDGLVNHYCQWEVHGGSDSSATVYTNLPYQFLKSPAHLEFDVVDKPDDINDFAILAVRTHSVGFRQPLDSYKHHPFCSPAQGQPPYPYHPQPMPGYGYPGDRQPNAAPQQPVFNWDSLNKCLPLESRLTAVENAVKTALEELAILKDLVIEEDQPYTG